MKNKKLFLFIIGIIICAVIVIMIKNPKEESEGDTAEITPMEEMTEEQERQTMISLYYTNIETNTLIPEARVIDAKELLENPYKTLVEYIIETPKNEKLKSSFKIGTKVNNATLNGDVVAVDLSKEFIEIENVEDIKLSIDAIVNTLTELNEVNAVKILIDGEENVNIENTEITLNENFTRTIT